MGTTVEKFNYAFGTKDLLKTEINKINNVLDDNSTFRSYPQELFNGYLDILNNGTDTLWNNLEKVSQTGTEAVLEGVETAPMKMVLNGNTSQDGTPSPDYPQEVKVVTGDNTINVFGKNMADKSDRDKGYFNADGTINTYYGNNSTYFKKYMIIPTSNFATITIKAKKKIRFTRITIYVYDKDYNALSGGSPFVWGDFVVNEGETRTITHAIKNNISQEASYFRMAVYSAFDNDNQNVPINTDFDEWIEEFQVEQGSTATDYVPYSKTDYPISLGTIEMCKIGNYEDFFFEAKNGDEYYDTLTAEQKNALNYGSWYKHKEIQKYAITGQENWIEFTNHFFKAESLFFNSKFVTGYGLCNQYVYNPTQSGLYASSSNNQFFLQYDRSYCHLFIRNDNYNDVTSWVSYLQSISNSILIYYPLATPTEEEITNTTLIEQLEAIYKAKSVKDKTYITQTNDELPFILDVQAIKEYEVV